MDINALKFKLIESLITDKYTFEQLQSIYSYAINMNSVSDFSFVNNILIYDGTNTDIQSSVKMINSIDGLIPILCAFSTEMHSTKSINETINEIVKMVGITVNVKYCYTYLNKIGGSSSCPLLNSEISEILSTVTNYSIYTLICKILKCSLDMFDTTIIAYLQSANEEYNTLAEFYFCDDSAFNNVIITKKLIKENAGHFKDISLTEHNVRGIYYCTSYLESSFYESMRKKFGKDGSGTMRFFKE